MTANAQESFAAWCIRQQGRLEVALTDAIPVSGPTRLGEAMRHATLGGGKRLRALLALAAAEAVAGGADALQTTEAAAALRAACALELIHAYSLVHDDMPCMDNDVLRRGKPTVHVAYGEAMALLAGDALQTLAFETLTPPDGSVNPCVQAALCGLLARASGHQGMAGGQALDLASVGVRLDEKQLRLMHRLKTGALLAASVTMGAACVPDRPASARDALARFGEAVGLAFQVVDDILDVTADTATLGKTVGKDAADDKPTYVSVLGLERSRAYAHTLHQQALDALDASGLSFTTRLRDLTALVVQREK